MTEGCVGLQTETAELGAGIKGRLVAGLAATAISLSVQPALAKPRLPPLDPGTLRAGSKFGAANIFFSALTDLAAMQILTGARKLTLATL